MQTGFARLAPFSGYKGIFLLSILILLLIAVLTAVDQFIKMTVITNLKPIGSVTCIPGLLEFRYLENNGAAFGFFAGLSWLLIILTIGLMAALLVLLSVCVQLCRLLRGGRCDFVCRVVLIL